MPINPKSGETENEFVSRCISEEIKSGKEQQQAAAICYSKWREEHSSMSSVEKTNSRINQFKTMESMRMGTYMAEPTIVDSTYPGEVASGSIVSPETL